MERSNSARSILVILQVHFGSSIHTSFHFLVVVTSIVRSFLRILACTYAIFSEIDCSLFFDFYYKLCFIAHHFNAQHPYSLVEQRWSVKYVHDQVSNSCFEKVSEISERSTGWVCDPPLVNPFGQQIMGCRRHSKVEQDRSTPTMDLAEISLTFFSRQLYDAVPIRQRQDSQF